MTKTKPKRIVLETIERYHFGEAIVLEKDCYGYYCVDATMFGCLSKNFRLGIPEGKYNVILEPIPKRGGSK